LLGEDPRGHHGLGS